jgi:hypothetical protein
MGREVRRVPLDFDWPIRKIWTGFVNPHNPRQCAKCEGKGDSPEARRFHDEWYGFVPFDPASTGSKPHGPTHPRIVARAKRNVQEAPWCGPVDREARRLARDCFDSHWSHHLSQVDVDALVEAERLMDFTHTFTQGTGWAKKDPPYHPKAAEVNDWSLFGMAHDSINAWVCVKARCEREGVPHQCATCKGDGTDPTDAETVSLSEAWKPTPPPNGDGYQMWEDTSEGSPISPVFETPELLARWLADNGASSFGNDTATYEQWLPVCRGAWAPSMVMRDGVLTSGVAAAAELGGGA